LNVFGLPKTRERNLEKSQFEKGDTCANEAFRPIPLSIPASPLFEFLRRRRTFAPTSRRRRDLDRRVDGDSTRTDESRGSEADVARGHEPQRKVTSGANSPGHSRELLETEMIERNDSQLSTLAPQLTSSTLHSLNSPFKSKLPKKKGE